MSTITRELAKLFRKITNSEIDAEGNAHVVLSPADSLLINNARIALASLEAVPVAWAHRLINKRNGVVHPWVYGSAEACPSEGDIFNIEVMPLYTVPPAPVSVPAAMEMDDDFDSAFEHGKAVGWNACRAAMLQGADGNSPVIPDGWKLVPIEPTEAMMLHKSGCQHHAWDDQDCAMRQTRRLIWSHMLAAAPQQESKNV